MKPIANLLVAIAEEAGIVASASSASKRAGGGAAPTFGSKIYPGYRDSKLISVAREEGDLDDIRAIRATTSPSSTDSPE